MNRSRIVALFGVVFLVAASFYTFLQTESWLSIYGYLDLGSWASRSFGGIGNTNGDGDDDDDDANETLTDAELAVQSKFTDDVLPRTSEVSYTSRNLTSGVKYFIYSPSGGFNNQRIEMETAMIISKMLNRTLIVPPMGKHSSFYGRYELLTPTQVVPMDKIFDFRVMNEFVPCVPIGNFRLISYVKELQARYDVRILFHHERQNWQERDIIPQMGRVRSRILFLRGAEMYHNWNFAHSHTSKMFTTVRFTEGIRRVASDCIFSAFPDGRFNAIHVRMGDYSPRTPSASVYERQMANRGFKTDVPLYIATEPSTPKSYFREICNKYKCFFSKDLDTPLLNKFAEAVPQGQIRMDMLGVVEQLICVAAVKFVGTSFSTFSLKIAQMRSFKHFAFPEFHRPSGNETTSKQSDPSNELLGDGNGDGDY